MENQNQDQAQQEIDSSLVGKEIGKHKYNYLKDVPKEKLTDLEKRQIEVYEERNGFNPEAKKRQDEYFNRIRNKEPKPEVKIQFTAEQLLDVFKNYYQFIHNKPFLETKDTLRNLYPLIFYFSQDKRFFACKNLSQLSVPSFEKGLLIIGGFGSGKSSVMKTFEKIFETTPFIFRGYTTYYVNKLYKMVANKQYPEEEYDRKILNGTRYFDDMKTEDEIGDFGVKKRIFKEILEERYYRKSKTHLTCNYKKDFPSDIKEALNEFEEKYGERNYDRIFEMFNIIEFKGKSFRN